MREREQGQDGKGGWERDGTRWVELGVCVRGGGDLGTCLKGLLEKSTVSRRRSPGLCVCLIDSRTCPR
jgi:hypothetical protein